MEDKIKAVASVLRSTEPMAAQFVERVQSRVGQPVSPDQVLAAMQKISTKSLTLDKVVAKVSEMQEREQRAASRRQTAQARKQTRSTTRRPADSTPQSKEALSDPDATSQDSKTKGPITLTEKIGAILEKNWDRAEAEGLKPERMSVEAFIKSVYHYTDRREASRRRILRAAQQLDSSDVLLNPALVADVTHQLFTG
jgi:hypothetical protein